MERPGKEATRLAKDPVCGMDVDEATAKEKYEYYGRTYFFCCKGCRLEFQDDPEKFIGPGQGGASEQA